jgi:hypothetical protein
MTLYVRSVTVMLNGVSGLRRRVPRRCYIMARWLLLHLADVSLK